MGPFAEALAVRGPRRPRRDSHHDGLGPEKTLAGDGDAEAATLVACSLLNSAWAARMAGKGHAARYVQAELGAAAEECVCAGDTKVTRRDQPPPLA